MPGEGSPFDVPPAAIGRYRVLHQIGAGSLGPVFRGDDPESHQPVAIKLLKCQLTPERAGRVAGRLRALVDRLPRSAALARLRDAGLHQVEPYFVTDLATGDSLDVALREYGPAAIVDALPRLRALAQVLDVASAQSLWHGALHPRDILVSADDTVLVGLGIAQTLDQEGVRLPPRRPYAAPEIVDGGRTSAAADRFSLAAIAHEWLFGRRITGPAEEPLAVPALPDVDGDLLAAAFTRALSPAPGDRFQSAAAFVTALAEACLDEEGTLFVPPRPPVAAAAADADDIRPSLDSVPLARDTSVDSISLVRDRSVAPTGADLRLTTDAAKGAALSDAFAAPATIVTSDDLRPPDPPVEAAPRFADVAADPPPRSASVFWQPVDPDEPAEDTAAEPVEVAAGYGLGALLTMLIVGLVSGGVGGYWVAKSRMVPAGQAQTGGASYTENSIASGEPAAPSAPAATQPPAAVDRTSAAGGATEVTEQPIVPPPDAPRSADARQPAPAPSVPAAVPSVPAAQQERRAETTRTVTPRPEVRPAPPRSQPSRTASRGAQPRDTADATGRLLITSTPADASVTIDGVPRGVTPLTVRELPFGAHAVVVSRPGYTPLRWTVTLSAAQPAARIDAPLVATRAKVQRF